MAWNCNLACYASLVWVVFFGDKTVGDMSVALEESVFHVSLAIFNPFPGRISSGSQPEDADDFAFLKAQGVQTVVSVDGAKPDVEAAKKLGLRYVHLPIGYDGVPKETQAALRNLLTENDGRIFIHCHHGKHRGPAAASIAAMLDGAVTKEEALELMKTGGTSPDYAGLWRDVREFTPPTADARAAPLVEVAETDSLTDAMVGIDEIFERLTDLKKSAWHPDPKHPDVVADQQALLLMERFRESARLTVEANQGHDLVEALTHSESLSKSLLDSLKAGDPVDADRHFDAVAADCRACHKEHRN